jgi:hypothetical protein
MDLDLDFTGHMIVINLYSYLLKNEHTKFLKCEIKILTNFDPDKGESN